MKGDFSRQTFRPEKHYSGVRMQQGRAHLDADWNEQVDIEAYRDAATAVDVIGPVGAPFEGGGFAVSGASFLRGIGFVNADEAWAVGERGALLRTIDKGESWTLQPAPAAGNLNAVAIVSATDAWAAGDGGALAHFNGSSWSAVSVTGVSAALRALSFVDATHGWAVGDDGTILFFDGSSWAEQNVPELTATLRGVHFTSASKGWAVGDGGTIVATTDGGVNWTAQSAPAGTPALRSVFFTSASAGCAVGDGGTILTTADGGATWTGRYVTAVSAALRAVRFETSGQNGWAVGEDATVIATANGGGTWAREDAAGAGQADLTGLAVFGGTRLACGGNTIVRRATGPVRWLTRPLPARGRDLVISAGDLYVGGVRCENDWPVGFTSQPDLPGVLPNPPGSGSELRGAYLIRREEHLTATEREEIREVALRGPDTSTRTRVSWHVHLTGVLADASCAALKSALPAAGGAGRLRARSQPVELPASECTVAPTGGYRRLENQLYRVEIHDPGPIDPSSLNGHATYKWSRDNGSMVARLEQLNVAGPSIGVSTTGRDDVLGFAAEQWVEVTDESRSRKGLPGILLEVDKVEGKRLDVVSFPPRPGGGSWSMADFPVNPTVRRWDGQADVPDGWEELEDGVQVEFGGGPFETGDFWTVPARTITGTVEWPYEHGVPDFRRSQGAPPEVAPLGVVRVYSNGDWEGVRDCRRRFPALTSLTELYYVGGDGQEAMPDSAAPQSRIQLARPLEVGVSNWRWPEEGARVRFTVTAGNGTLDGPSATQVITQTNAQGVASCSWFVDGSTQSQRVEAFLLDKDDLPVQTPVHFGANLSVASQVAYDPAGCARLAGAKTVQAAIANLASRARLEKAGGDDQEVMPAEALDPIQVRVVSDCGPVSGARVQFVVVDAAPAGGTVNGQRNIVVGPTPNDGMVGANWALGNGRGTQYVEAVLLDVDGVAVQQPAPSVRFAATLSTADHVSYEPPAGCAALKDDDTVQEAIDHLAGMASLYRLRGDGQSVTPDNVSRLHPLEVLVASGCGPIKGASVEFRIRQGKGRLQGQQGPAMIDTDDNGVASCDWTLDKAASNQLVEARLVKLPDVLAGLVIQPPALVQFIAHLTGEEATRRPSARAGMVAAGELPELQARRWIDVPMDTLDYATDPEMHDGQGLRATADGIYLVTAQVTWSTDVIGQLELNTAAQRETRLAFSRTTGGVLTASTVQQLKGGDDVHARVMHFNREPAAIVGGADTQNLTLTWLAPLPEG